MSLATLGNAAHQPPKGRNAMRGAAAWFALVLGLGAVLVVANGETAAGVFFAAVAALLVLWLLATRSRSKEEPKQ